MVEVVGLEDVVDVVDLQFPVLVIGDRFAQIAQMLAHLGGAE